MKTEYKILWIDDALNLVRGDIRNIERFLLSKKVDLAVEKVSVAAGNSVFDDNVFTNAFEDGELDFVLIDLNMPDVKGDDVISYIRNDLNDYYTPIVFYSGDGIEHLTSSIDSKNSDVAIEKYLDGIFFCHRDDITLKMTNLMSSKIDREHKIKAVRGMLMENVSDLDVKIIEALRLSFEHIEENKKSTVLAKIIKKFNDRKNGSVKTVEDLSEASYEDSIEYILDNLRKTDQHFRAEILRYILRYTSDFKGFGEILSTFYNPKEDQPSLNCFRNDYAHKTEEELEGIHNHENNLLIKSEVKKHKENLRKIIAMRTTDE